MAHGQSKRQAKAKGERKKCVSPRSGAVADGSGGWKPGVSGNPAGSSAKQRLRAAFERAVTEEASRGVASKLLEVVKDPGHKHYPQAVAILSRIMSLFTDETKQEVVVTTDVNLVDRRDGERPVVQVRTVSSSGGGREIEAGGSASIEVEV